MLVIPEKYEPIIFHTYHDSLLAGHQGPFQTAMTIRQKFFIHNLMNKVKRYIEACHICLKTKPKYTKNRPMYGWILVDYTPMQDLLIDIKTMPQAFGGYHLLLVITCDQTNFTIAVPLRDRQTQNIAEALIYRVIYLFGQIKTISEIIVKHHWDKGQMRPLFATTAAYAMNMFASEALSSFSSFQLVFL